jgi:hypothetical protein
MSSGMRTCPECGSAVAPRDAGCPSCGRILDRRERAVDGANAVHEGTVEGAPSGGTGWTSLVLAGCGCLVFVALLAVLFAWVVGS